MGERGGLEADVGCDGDEEGSCEESDEFGEIFCGIGAEFSVYPGADANKKDGKEEVKKGGVVSLEGEDP